MRAKRIVSRFKALESERSSSVEQLWDLIERFVLPFRGDFYRTLDQEQTIDWHRREIYDSTAVFAVQSLAASLQGNLTNPAQRWFDLQFRDDDMNTNDRAKEWLEAVAQEIYDSLQESNFDIEMSEGYIDLVGFGTSVLVEEVSNEVEWDGLNFQAIPIREFYFEEDHKKQVRVLYRRLEMTAVQMVSQFGDDCPQWVKEKAESDSGPTERIHVIFCIYPRDGMENADVSKILTPKKRPFGFKYVIKSTSEQIGDEGGYYEMPAFVARWRKTSGSRWGHSPSAVALADILTLNQLVQTIYEAAGKVIDPAALVNEDAVIGDLDLDRGGLNVVQDVNGIIPFESGSRFDVGELQVGNLQESIRQAYYQDQLQLKESPAMTATEANIRWQMMQRLLGPTLGRLKTDLLDKLLERTFNILFRAGRLPEVPEGLEISELDIEYTGPLPRAQKLEVSEAIGMWMAEIAQLAEIYPEALDIVDVDEAVRHRALLMGVPAKAMRAEEDIEEIREERNQKRAEAESAAMAQQHGEAAQAVGAGAEAMGTIVPAA